MNTSKVGENIRTIRRGRKESQSKFAKIVGCSRVSISMYETGKTQPPAELYINILKLRGKNMAVKDDRHDDNIPTNSDLQKAAEIFSCGDDVLIPKLQAVIRELHRDMEKIKKSEEADSPLIKNGKRAGRKRKAT